MIASQVTRNQIVEFTRQVAQLVDAELPLVSGLRAFAVEVSDKNFRLLVEGVAQSLEDGLPLDGAIEKQGAGFPNFLRGLILAGVRSNQLAQVLHEYIRTEQSFSRNQRSIIVGVAYPTILLCLTFGVMLLFLNYAVKPLADIYVGWGIRFSFVHEWLFSVSDFLVDHNHLVLIIYSLCSIALFGLMFGGFRISYRVPIFGSIWRLAAASEFCRMLALLIRAHIPTPQSLRLLYDVSRDPGLSLDALMVARHVEAGASFGREFTTMLRLPSQLDTLIDSVQTEDQLADLFVTFAEVWEQRAAARAIFLKHLLSGLLFAFAMIGVWGFLICLLYPLLRILGSLA